MARVMGAERGRTRTFPPGASSPDCPFGLLILGDNWRVNSPRPCSAAWNRRATTQRLKYIAVTRVGTG